MYTRVCHSWCLGDDTTSILSSAILSKYYTCTVHVQILCSGLFSQLQSTAPFSCSSKECSKERAVLCNGCLAPGRIQPYSIPRCLAPPRLQYLTCTSLHVCHAWQRLHVQYMCTYRCIYTEINYMATHFYLRESPCLQDPHEHDCVKMSLAHRLHTTLVLCTRYTSTYMYMYIVLYVHTLYMYIKTVHI